LKGEEAKINAGDLAGVLQNFLIAPFWPINFTLTISGIFPILLFVQAMYKILMISNFL
jgi:hypothetical protein